MMTFSTSANRPVFGFVVEGSGEHAVYPSLVARIVGSPVYTRAVNAEGYGGILGNLEEHLDELVSVCHPVTIIVTVDLRDVVDAGACADCVELLQLIGSTVRTWQASRLAFPIMDPMPQHIAVVAQIPTFESWWIADPDALNSLHGISIDPAECNWRNVDDEVPNAEAFLRSRCQLPLNLKSPTLAKEVMGTVSIQVVQQRSRSFRKFVKEIRAGFDRWQQTLLTECQ